MVLGQIAKDVAVTHILVESDSAMLMALLHSTYLDLHPLGTLILNCQSIISYFSSCSISHVHCERNMVANCLAKRSIDADFGLYRLPTVPDFVVDAIMDGIAGLARPRAVPIAGVVV